MKKIIITALICGGILLGITGCGKSDNEFNIGEKSDIKISEDNVLFSIKDGSLKKTGATLVLTNNSDKHYHYGNPYKIEVKQNGEWHKINVELNFTLPAFGLKPGETKEIDLDWENGYGKLSAGTYRIIKGIDYEIEEGNHEQFYIAVEFDIK